MLRRCALLPRIAQPLLPRLKEKKLQSNHAGASHRECKPSVAR